MCPKDMGQCLLIKNLKCYVEKCIIILQLSLSLLVASHSQEPPAVIM